MNKKNIINVLIAVPERDSRIFTELLQSSLKSNPYFQVLHFYTVHNIANIDMYVEQRQVDVVICAEDLGEEKLGQGCIKRWKQYDDSLRIVMILSDDKRKGQKVSNFLKNGYYEALFFHDLTPDTIIGLIANGRTEQEAGEYYFSEPAKQEQNMDAIENISSELQVSSGSPAFDASVENEMEEEFESGVTEATIDSEEDLAEILVMSEKEDVEEDTNTNFGDETEIVTYVGKIQMAERQILDIRIDQAIQDYEMLEGCRVIINCLKKVIG